MLHDAGRAHVESPLRVRVHRVRVILVILNYWNILHCKVLILTFIKFKLYFHFLEGPTGQIKSAQEWYHWVGPSLGHSSLKVL
jgi:hypothetical protein